MSALSTTILAFSMSADAFAASISKGTALRRPRLWEAVRTGLVFGGVETLTPIVGWLLGLAAASYIAAIDHWIAFAILGGLGVKLIVESLGQADEPRSKAKPRRHGLGILLLTALGTSVDALAVGVTLAFVNANILITALAIGAATFTMATIGLMTGHYIGSRAGHWAEFLGGLGLIAIGTAILCEHLQLIVW